MLLLTKSCRLNKQSTLKTILKDFLDVIASPCSERGVQLLKAGKIYILYIHSILVSTSSLSITSAKHVKGINWNIFAIFSACRAFPFFLFMFKPSAGLNL